MQILLQKFNIELLADNINERGGLARVPLNQKETINMAYNQYGEEIPEQEAIDEAFTLLALDLELDEDDLRNNERLIEQVKDFVLDTGITWDNLVETCDEAFGTIEERLDEPTDEN